MYTNFIFGYKICWLELDSGILSIFEKQGGRINGKIHLKISEIV